MKAALEKRTLVPYGRFGECRLRFDTDGILVERADPIVLLTESFLARLARTEAQQWVTLTYQPNDWCEPADCCQRWRGTPHCYTGTIVTIWGKNAHIIYRVTAYRPAGMWEAKLEGHT